MFDNVIKRQNSLIKYFIKFATKDIEVHKREGHMQAILYKTKVKHVSDSVFRQLTKLSNGADGHMIYVLLHKPNADVYYWLIDNKVVSWASISTKKHYKHSDNDLFDDDLYDYNESNPINVKEVNLYTSKKYRGKGFAGETLDFIKKDFKRKQNLLYGHGECTTLIMHKNLKSFT